MYRGEDAVPKGPVVHKYVAEERGPVKEWWVDHKRAVKIFSGVGGITVIVAWLLYELTLLIF